MKRILAMTITLMLLVLPAALAEEDVALYEGPVLVFNAPRDAELIWNETTASSYVQALSCACGEIIVSAAFPSVEERDAFIETLLDGAYASALPITAFDSLHGHSAQRVVTAMTTGFAEGDQEDTLMARFIQPCVKHAIHCVTVDASRAYLFAAALPEDAGYDDLTALVENQIDSLELFDPDARIMLEPETEQNAGACLLAGEIIQDADAQPFLVYALDTVRDVCLSTVTLDAEGNLATDVQLGEWSELNFGEAIRIKAYLPDVLPGFALRFTDESGVGRTLYITMSGLDGTLLLIGE